MDKIRRLLFLSRFDKVSLSAGQSTTVTWSIPASELEYIGVDSWYILESGQYFIGIGPDADCRALPNSPNCVSFELATSESYNKVCSTACSIWQHGVCGQMQDFEVCSSTCQEQAWTWDYVNCLESAAIGIAIL